MYDKRVYNYRYWLIQRLCFWVWVGRVEGGWGCVWQQSWITNICNGKLSPFSIKKEITQSKMIDSLPVTYINKCTIQWRHLVLNIFYCLLKRTRNGSKICQPCIPFSNEDCVKRQDWKIHLNVIGNKYYIY